MIDVSKCKNMQNLARETMNYLETEIFSGITEIEIKHMAEEFMLSNGAERFWYHNIGALILAGTRSIKSYPGILYSAKKYKVKSTDIITIDLSPESENHWGDYARTIIIDQGSVIQDPINHKSENHEVISWINSLKFENHLHQSLISLFDPRKLISDIHREIDSIIQYNGYQNLDFKNNFGHSIELKKAHRRWFDRNNHNSLHEFQLFTFEPHIRFRKSNYGFKYENIYHFDGFALQEL